MENNIENKIKNSIERIQIDSKAQERGLERLMQEHENSGYTKQSKFNILTFLQYAVVFSLIVVSIPVTYILVKEYINLPKDNITNNPPIDNNQTINTKASPIAFKGVNPSLVTPFVLNSESQSIFEDMSNIEIINKALDQMNSLISYKAYEVLENKTEETKSIKVSYSYNNPDILSSTLEYKTNAFPVVEEIKTKDSYFVRTRTNETSPWSGWTNKESDLAYKNIHSPSTYISIPTNVDIEITRTSSDTNIEFKYMIDNTQYVVTITPSLTISKIQINTSDIAKSIEYSDFNKNFGVLPAKMMQTIDWEINTSKILSKLETNIQQSPKENRSYLVEYKSTDTTNPKMISGFRYAKTDQGVEKAQYTITTQQSTTEVRIIGEKLYVKDTANNKWDEQTNTDGFTSNDYEKLAINEVMSFYLNNKDKYEISEIVVSDSHSIHLKNFSYMLKSISDTTNYLVDITYNQYYEVVGISIHKYDGEQYISSEYIDYHNPTFAEVVEIPEEFIAKEETLTKTYQCNEYRNIKKSLSKLTFNHSSLLSVTNNPNPISTCNFNFEYNGLKMHIRNTDDIEHSNYFETASNYTIVKTYTNSVKIVRVETLDEISGDTIIGYRVLDTDNKLKFKSPDTIQEWIATVYIPKNTEENTELKFLNMTDEIIKSFKEI